MNDRIILTYHAIGESDLFIEVPFSSFKKQIIYLNNIAEIVDLDTILNNKNHTKHKQVHIMFDDAFKSAYIAMQYMDSMQLPYSVAIVDRFLTDVNYCNVTDLCNLKKATFVFHTKTHRKLTELNDSEIEKELICESKKTYPLIVRNDIIVYPDGVYDSRTIQIASAVNYKYGLTCLPFHISKNENNYQIPRINVNGFLSFKKFKLFISVLGNAYLHLAYTKRKILGENYLAK